MSVVLVIGASGTTGRVVADLLRQRGERVRAASRAPSAGDGVRFEWEDLRTHGAALAGVDRVYLVPPPSAVDPLPLVEPFLAEARRRDVARLVMLGSGLEFPLAPGRLELAARVRAQYGWTVLNPTGFMQNFLRPHPLGTAVRDRAEIATASGSGRMAWIDARDVAETAVTALIERADPMLADELQLTGPRTLGYGDVAAMIAAETGRSVAITDLTPDALAERYQAAGLPKRFAASLAAIEDDVRLGRYDFVTSAVLDLTGRPPRTFENFVSEHAGEWTSQEGHA